MLSFLRISICCLAALLFAGRTPGADLVLDMPVECEMGRVCFIQNYFDHDPGPLARDYTCGMLSYDGHTGTDIRVPDLTVMREGINVLAAAPGVVKAVRDGMQDINVNVIGREAVEKRGLGNAVIINHGDGWITHYGHLKKGSVKVKPGEKVSTGRILGQIGMSGLAEFPHVEFAALLNGKPVDPFVGVTNTPGCGFTATPLWSEAASKRLTYKATGMLSAGFTSVIPKPEQARSGRHRADTLTITAPLMVFWADVLGVQEGDEERATLIAPDGKVLAENCKKLDQFRAQHFMYIVKRKPGVAWPEGRYTARYVLSRMTAKGRKIVIDESRYVIVR